MPHLFFFLLIITAANWSLEQTVPSTSPLPAILPMRTSIIADTSRPEASHTIGNNKEEEVESLPIFVTEKMPLFPGCEELAGSYADKKNCADQKLLAYIYNNIKYPSHACVEGVVVVSFTVTAAGKIEEVQVLRDIGAGTAEEAKRVVESMNELEPWTPASSINGTPVSMKYNLPIRFRLH